MTTSHDTDPTAPEAADPALTEARELARLALDILRSMPTCLGDFHPSLEDDRLPTWADGEAETWQREPGDAN